MRYILKRGLALLLTLALLTPALAAPGDDYEKGRDEPGREYLRLTLSGNQLSVLYRCDMSDVPAGTEAETVFAVWYPGQFIQQGRAPERWEVTDLGAEAAPANLEYSATWILEGGQTIYVGAESNWKEGETSVGTMRFVKSVLWDAAKGAYTLADVHDTETPSTYTGLSVLEQNQLREEAFRFITRSKIDPMVREKSDELCAGLTTDMEKLLAIRNWVCENIYYDYPDFYGEVVEDEMPGVYGAPRTLALRRGVCADYAGLTANLLMAQEIPCVEVSGYALGIGAPDHWTPELLANAEQTNHAWNEAWVDGRWITLDTTWDSNNSYTGPGQWTKGPLPDTTYFDPDPAVFANSHRIAMIGAKFYEEDVPSPWAQEEITQGMLALLYPACAGHGTFAGEIDRQDFCELMVALVERCVGMDILDYLAQKDLILAEPFPDCQEEAVRAACALDLIQGRIGPYRGAESQRYFDPYSNITRQEAAIMMTNCARYLGLSTGRGAAFADAAAVSEWAADGVAFVSGLWDGDRAVMGDAGGGTFDPLGTYTREQAMVSALRLYHVAKAQREG